MNRLWNTKTIFLHHRQTCHRTDIAGTLQTGEGGNFPRYEIVVCNMSDRRMITIVLINLVSTWLTIAGLSIHFHIHYGGNYHYLLLTDPKIWKNKCRTCHILITTFFLVSTTIVDDPVDVCHGYVVYSVTWVLSSWCKLNSHWLELIDKVICNMCKSTPAWASYYCKLLTLFGHVEILVSKWPQIRPLRHLLLRPQQRPRTSWMRPRAQSKSLPVVWPFCISHYRCCRSKLRTIPTNNCKTLNATK